LDVSQVQKISKQFLFFTERQSNWIIIS